MILGAYETAPKISQNPGRGPGRTAGKLDIL